jgi:radical SAM superfamily enzyme YgiQ (UPF0313 family)
MSWKIIEKYRAILACEEGSVPRDWGGKLSVCLVYPNRYHVAMGNLGFQAVYRLFNDRPDVVCERTFLPDPEELQEYERSRTPLLSLESQRPIASFDVVAFSISFENDYLNLPRILQLAGIPPRAAERPSTMPLVMAGGAAMFLNPEPVAEFMDLVCIGEAEAILPQLADLLGQRGAAGRGDFLLRAAGLSGIYVPTFYEVTYDGERLASIASLAGAPPQVERVWSADLARSGAASEILSPQSEFGDMYLIEVSRGCPRGCRFCAAGFIYLPYRQRPLNQLKAEVAKGLQVRGKIGLVGAAVSDYRGIGELCRHIRSLGGKMSVSSLRIDSIDDEMIDTLVASGHKTVALAPEGGSQRMRDLINKDITEAQILAACDRLIGKDILNLKLYFIIGLPSETLADLEEMVGLVTKIRERAVATAKGNRRLGTVVLSINPFVPKPFTPFQWCGMEEVAALDKKGAYLRKALGCLSNVRLQMESPRDAYLQALLARGDRRLAAFILRAAELGSWKRAAREFPVNTDRLVHRLISLDELLPWDVIAGGSRERLVREYRRAFGHEP